MSHNGYTAEEITAVLTQRFAGPLIVTTLGWILFGVNICQFLHYIQVLARRDHVVTRILVCIVMGFTSTASSYQVYSDWSYSIKLFLDGPTAKVSYVNGNLVAMYSLVIMLVQYFWLGCVNRLMFTSGPRRTWSIIAPIGFLSFSAFILAIVVTILSHVRPGHDGSWPTPTISILLRIALGLFLGVDIAILVVITSQLTMLRKSSHHLKRTISKLSRILCGVTLVSTLVMLAELIIDFPQLGKKGFITIAITFSPLLSPLYAFGMLAVLNQRTDLWLARGRSRSSQGGVDSKGLIPGMKFTIDTPNRQTTTSTAAASTSTCTTIRSPRSRPIPLSDAHSRKSDSEGIGVER